MLSLNDIINVSFRKSGFSGYRAEDVDVFIDKVRESYDELLKKGLEKDEQIDRLNTEGKQTSDKLKILADKIEEYRAQEDEIKNALISAQKLGDASVREARHKAEIIVKDANQKAERIIANADEKIAEQKRELERLQRTVSEFRSKLLNAYKEHLTLIDALPAAKPQAALPVEEKTVQAAPQEPDASAEPQEPEAEEASSPFRADISNFDDEALQNE